MHYFRVAILVGMLGALSVARGGLVTIDYLETATGSTTGLNGLSAQAQFNLVGNQLTVTLRNTSAGIPSGFGASASLVSSLAFNLPTVTILSGQSALIAPDSQGVGAWSGRGAGASVGDQWAWSNAAGMNMMGEASQVISTVRNTAGSEARRFDGSTRSVGNAWGGIGADPLVVTIPGSREAVSGALVFRLTLSGTLTDAELASLAYHSMVEFGNADIYLRAHPVPAPGAALLGILGFVTAEGARRRSARSDIIGIPR